MSATELVARAARRRACTRSGCARAGCQRCRTQSPRYSPVGSPLSVKLNDCSQPTFSVPPALMVLRLRRVSRRAHRRDDGEDRHHADEPRQLTNWASSRLVSPSFSRAATARGFASDRDVRRRTVTVSWRLARSADRFPSPVCPDVERVAQTVAEQVEGKRGDHEEEAREQHQPPGDVVEALGVVQEPAPRGRVAAARRARGTRARPRRGCSAGSAASCRR